MKQHYKDWLLARDFQTIETPWGVICNLADTPFFVDSHASRLVHGLAHQQVIDQNYMCPACLSRRVSQAFRGTTGEDNVHGI